MYAQLYIDIILKVVDWFCFQNLSIRRQKRLEGEGDFADPAASDPESNDDSRVKEKPKSAATGRGRGSRGGRGRGSRGGGSGHGSRGGRGSSSSSSSRGGRGSRGKKNAESAAMAATSTGPSLAAAASPSLTFSSSGATRSPRPMVCDTVALRPLA